MAFVPDAQQQPDTSAPAPSRFVPDTPHRPENLGILGAAADNPALKGDAEPSLGKFISGIVDMGATGVQNIPHGIAHAAVDVARHLGAGDPNAPDPKFVQALQAHMLPETEPVAQAVADTGTAQKLAQLSQAAKGVLQQDLGVQPWAVDDAMNLAPALGPGARLSELGAKLAAMPARGAEAADAFTQAGLRTAADHPVAQAVAGKSGKDALTVQNQKVANVVAANAAGHPIDAPMTPESLTAARAAPAAVYQRAASALPDAPLSENAANKINAIDQRPVTVTMPDAQTSIGALKTSLLDGSPRTGDQVISDLRALRQKGYANVGSDSVAEQEIGKAQLDAADALEQHIQDTLPPDADVSMDQLAAARQQMAKNFTVQGVLKGGDVDMGALARIRRANPQLMTGGLKLLADFADQNPAITGVASKMYEPPSLAGDITGIKLDQPASYLKALGTGPIARRILTGSQADALAKAQGAFPAYDASRFAPLQRTAAVAPAPPPMLALPAPSMVNAGGGATTQNTLESLGLTPDVQRAALAHPASPVADPQAISARLQALATKMRASGQSGPQFASGGSVDDSGASSDDDSDPAVPPGAIQAIQQLPPAVLSTLGLNRVANLQVPAMDLPSYARGGRTPAEGVVRIMAVGQIPHELRALIDRVARLPRRSST